jgi:hypothetical protein
MIRKGGMRCKSIRCQPKTTLNPRRTTRKPILLRMKNANAEGGLYIMDIALLNALFNIYNHLAIKESIVNRNIVARVFMRLENLK